MPNEALSSFEDNAVYAIDTTTIDLCLEVFLVGEIQEAQSCRETAHSVGHKDLDCSLHMHYRQQGA